jgi:hypothetical protein
MNTLVFIFGVKFCPKKWAIDKYKGFCCWGGGGGGQMALNLSPHYEEKLFEVAIFKY